MKLGVRVEGRNTTRSIRKVDVWLSGKGTSSTHGMWGVGGDLSFCSSLRLLARLDVSANPEQSFESPDSCITQLKAQGPSRTCNESKEEEEKNSLNLGTVR